MLSYLLVEDESHVRIAEACVDTAKSQVHALDRTQPGPPLKEDRATVDRDWKVFHKADPPLRSAAGNTCCRVA